MKKPTLIIGKRQIILSCLTALLAVAVYINYSVSRSDAQLTTPVSELTAQEEQHYGDTEFVSAAVGEETAADTFFAQARMDRMTGRDEAVQTLQMIMGGGDLTDDEIITTALDAVEVSSLIESEGTIESLIKSQGFEDCVVYLDGDTAKVVVRTDGLDAAGAALIKGIILDEVAISSENIRIFEVK